MADMSKLTIREHYSKPASEQDDDGSMTDHHPAWRPGVARDITTGFSTAASGQWIQQRCRAKLNQRQR